MVVYKADLFKILIFFQTSYIRLFIANQVDFYDLTWL